ncbi:hypothetical protein AJ80_04970 [Polytolypa hystricis UAMH7299]|uniref:tRNA-splicing endonuclease subunit Sen54 N-terminal domain-containing protein n=1 Tax=Polytolypa hystricis (strain UAMH7299) TaxID=1447883 RepID=A0A2B7Y907_POLH7|nr:hypothetical protein AJ80_04970 [Polytolypa hystricis UAMH7299]
MADVDEDVIHQPASAPGAGGAQQHAGDHDISDETQDFRFLNNLSFLNADDQPSLPKRGEKDFEPNPTLLQSDTLDASRAAMHNALAYPRLHNPKTRLVGIYCPRGTLRPPSVSRRGDVGATIKEEQEENTDKGGINTASSSQNLEAEEDAGTQTPTAQKPAPAHGPGGDACVCVPNPRGQHFRTLGQADHWNRIWLLPEEALYLLERGSLDIRWPSSAGADNGLEPDPRDAEDGVPMSLQAAYACFIGRGALALERYTVYVGLKRGGYVVVRAKGGWRDGESSDERGDNDGEAGKEIETHAQARGTSLLGVLSRFFASIYDSRSTCNTAIGPVVGLGFHRSYNDIFRSLSLIPAYNPTLSHPSNHLHLHAPAPPAPSSPYHLAYNVYKPSTPFRKSNPPTPDFRLAVINARTTPHLPSLAQISALLADTPLDPPRGEKLDRMMYMRLRHGWRNVILAVVDQGIVSFLRIGDVGFVGERLYEQKSGGGGGYKGARRGGRGGGGAGRRGRK